MNPAKKGKLAVRQPQKPKLDVSKTEQFRAEFDAVSQAFFATPVDPEFGKRGGIQARMNSGGIGEIVKRKSQANS
jgi:hypothetical protein